MAYIRIKYRRVILRKTLSVILFFPAWITLDLIKRGSKLMKYRIFVIILILSTFITGCKMFITSTSDSPPVMIPPNLDENGWTLLDDSHADKIYVSSSQGSDDNPGTEDEPYKTINNALKQLEAGGWILLKRGDTFNEPINNWVNGISESQRTVFTAYGDVEQSRPIIDPMGSDAVKLTGAGVTPDRVEHVAITSIHLRQSRNNPNSSAWDGTPVKGNGIVVLRPGKDLLIEDVKVEFFSQGLNLQGSSASSPLSNLMIRRSVIVDSYSPASVGHSQGIFMRFAYSPLIEENIIDHNGWNDSVSGAQRTKFNHNVYIQRDCLNPVFRNNITSRASSHGFQMRPGGSATGNLVMNNSIGGYISNNNFNSVSVVEMMNNVAIHASVEPVTDSILGWGLALNATPDTLPPTTPLFRNNIMAHSPGEPENGATNPEDLIPLYQGLVQRDNIVYKWGNTPSDPGPFVDPERSIETYMASLGYQETTMEAFLDKARELRRYYWEREFTAEAVVEYFQEGFALSSTQ